MTQAQDFLKGIVFVCPIKEKQIALHRNLVNFSFWDSGLAGFELDIEIIECPGCKSAHTISIPLQIKV